MYAFLSVRIKFLASSYWCNFLVKGKLLGRQQYYPFVSLGILPAVYGVWLCDISYLNYILVPIEHTRFVEEILPIAQHVGGFTCLYLVLITSSQLVLWWHRLCCCSYWWGLVLSRIICLIYTCFVATNIFNMILYRTKNEALQVSDTPIPVWWCLTPPIINSHQGELSTTSGSAIASEVLYY